MSYALFPQIAKPFLKRRQSGLGGKEEVAAAIAAALFRQAEAKPPAQEPAAGPVQAANLWKMATRAGVQRGW